MDRQIQDIIALLKRTFEKDAWHGPAVKESLTNVNQDHAFSRVANTHNIIELVAHMTAWRRYVIHLLEGDVTYTVEEDLNFPPAKNWIETLRQLDDSQQRLLAAIEKFPPDRLNQQVPGKTSAITFFTLIHGIIHHDLYHTGQIMLIKKATGIQTI